MYQTWGIRSNLNRSSTLNLVVKGLKGWIRAIQSFIHSFNKPFFSAICQSGLDVGHAIWVNRHDPCPCEAWSLGEESDIFKEPLKYIITNFHNCSHRLAQVVIQAEKVNQMWSAVREAILEEATFKLYYNGYAELTWWSWGENFHIGQALWDAILDGCWYFLLKSGGGETFLERTDWNRKTIMFCILPQMGLYRKMQTASKYYLY